MKVWVVYFRGEPEYATRDYYDACSRAVFMRDGYCEKDVYVLEEKV